MSACVCVYVCFLPAAFAPYPRGSTVGGRPCPMAPLVGCLGWAGRSDEIPRSAHCARSPKVTNKETFGASFLNALYFCVTF